MFIITTDAQQNVFVYILADFPAIVIVSPVMQLASSEQRKATAPEQSSGSPILQKTCYNLNFTWSFQYDRKNAINVHQHVYFTDNGCT